MWHALPLSVPKNQGTSREELMRPESAVLRKEGDVRTQVKSRFTEQARTP